MATVGLNGTIRPHIARIRVTMRVKPRPWWLKLRLRLGVALMNLAGVVAGARRIDVHVEAGADVDWDDAE